MDIERGEGRGEMDEALLEVLSNDGNDRVTLLLARRKLAAAFEAALVDVIGASERASSSELAACVRRAVDSFLATPTPTSLETFLTRVATIFHCHTVLSAAGAATSQLNAGVRTAAITIAGVFFSPRFRGAGVRVDGHEDNHEGGGDNVVEEEFRGPHALWFCFLCVFLQQLSARGGDFAPWQSFFSECASFCEPLGSIHVSTGNAGGSQDEGEGNNNNNDTNEQLGMTAWGAVSENIFAATIARTRFRRTAILCKSFCPHIVAQAPGTTYQLLQTLHAFMSDWETLQQSTHYKAGEREEKEEELVGRYSNQLGRYLGDGQVHSFLLSTVIGAVLSSKYILSKREGRTGEATKWYPSRPDTALQSEHLWRRTHFPPIGLLLDRLHIRPLLGVHLFTFCMQLCIGLSPTHYPEGRQKLALCLYLMEVCSLRVALAVYHFAGSQLAQNMLETTTVSFPAEGIASLGAALDQYVQGAHTELIFATPESDTTRRRHQRHGTDAVKKSEDLIPVKGELAGPRFAKMVFSAPCPTWTQHLVEPRSTAATSTATFASVGMKKAPASATGTFMKQTASAQRVTPCQFVLTLLEMGLPALAAKTIAELQAEMEVNVCLVPGVAMPGVGSIASNVMQRAQIFLDERPENTESGGDPTFQRCVVSASLRALEAYFPLLSTIYAYVASQSFLCSLVEAITRECDKFLCAARQGQQGEVATSLNESDDTVDLALTCRNVLGLAERYLVRVIMPCMRIIEPSPILYDRVQALLTLLKEEGSVVNFGTSPAEFLHMKFWLHWLVRPPSSPTFRRAPHDMLRSKKLEALFVQSLKRMTQVNVRMYRNLLRPTIYANPLYVAEKLFQQAVGYGNNFLQIHTKLLKDAPAAVLTLIAQEGLTLMRQYAEQERMGTTDANRVGLIATFLSVLWRENPQRFDGCMLLRAAEYALRRESRASIVFGLELLKAILHEMLDLTLEHEEQYSVTQVKALIAFPSAQWFAKGAAESFRRGRWDACFTPAVLAAASSMLRSGLQEPCVVPVEREDDEEEETDATMETTSAQSQRHDKRPPVLTLTLGQCLLLHLCRLHSRIYTVQADLAGTMQLVLLTCARDYNVINDLLLSMEALLPKGPPAEEIFMVAMPHIALRLTARFAAKEAGQKSTDAFFTVTPSNISDYVGDVASSKYVDTAIPLSLLRKLSCHTAAHFVFDESVYTAASKEVNQFFNHAAAVLKAKKNDNHNNSAYHNKGGETNNGLSRDPSICWLQEQTRQIRHEKEAHRKLYEGYEAERVVLLKDLFQNGVLDKPVVFATSYLLPRALLSLEDTLFVCHFIGWMLDTTKPGMSSSSSGDANEENTDRCKYYNRVVDIVLSLITASMTFFVGFTDGECKRVGSLVSFLLTALQESTVEMPPLPSVSNPKTRTETASTTTNASPAATGGSTTASFSSSTITTEALMALLEPKPRSLMCIMAPHATTTGAVDELNKEELGSPSMKMTRDEKMSVPAYLAQLEAYMCRALVQLLVHQKDITFLHRNTFFILERLTKGTSNFPSTLCATEWLISAVAPHAVRSSPCYASATAVLRVLQDNRQRKKELLVSVSSQSSTQMTPQRDNGIEREVSTWRHMWNMREMYVRSLLAVDMAAAKSRSAMEAGAKTDIDDDGVEEEEEEEKEATTTQADADADADVEAEAEAEEDDVSSEEEEEGMDDTTSENSGSLHSFHSEDCDSEGSDQGGEQEFDRNEISFAGEETTFVGNDCCESRRPHETEEEEDEENGMGDVKNSKKRSREEEDEIVEGPMRATLRLEKPEDIENEKS